MSITEARQQQLLAGCNSLEAKVFEFVPILEAWPADQINRHIQASGKTSAEYKRVRASLGGLKDRGLIREVKRDTFQREAIKIRELRDAVPAEVSKPKLGDFMDAKALRKIAVPYTPPESIVPFAEAAVAMGVEALGELRDEAIYGGGVKAESIAAAMDALNKENAKIKPEPVKEVAPMNAIANVETQEQTAAGVALEAMHEISQEMETLTNEFGSRMNALRERLEVVALEVEELRDHETKSLAKFRAFKALMTTLSDD